MKKTIIPFMLIFALLFCSCSELSKSEADQTITELNASIESVNGQNKISGGYMLEITFGEGGVLYYANGDIAFDREANTVFADFSQTWLGASSEVENYYSNGKMISVVSGEAIESSRDNTEIFSKFPYFKLSGYGDDCKDLAVGNNLNGKTVSFTLSDTASVCEKVVGDVYSLVTVIKKPQKDKTRYGDTTVTYTVTEGEIVSCRYEFTVTVFDTPAYIPNYSQKESEYSIELKVNAKVDYNVFGENVVVKEYEAVKQ